MPRRPVGSTPAGVASAAAASSPPHTAAAASSPVHSAPVIRTLPSHTTHELRAAVVLCEPSQAVHEIVANALDAGALRVDIVVDFSRLAFTIADDGSGMTLPDLRMLGTRHVTSKCGDVLDLAGGASARTMGWRGEALSSLAQLCVLDIQTRPRGSTTQSQDQLAQQDWKRRKLDPLRDLTRHAFDGEAPLASASSLAVASPGATYSKVIRHGVESFCGFAASHRLQAGTTVSFSDLYAQMPVRAKLMREDKARGRERERLKKRIMRLALVHPNVEFALYDASIQQQAAVVASKHHFPDQSSGSAAATSPSLPLPVIPSQRVWFKPRTSSLLANFHCIFGARISARNNHSQLTPPLSPHPPGSPNSLFAAEHDDLAGSLVELRRFAPVTPEATTPATTAFLRGMRVSGFLSHPAKVFLHHRDMQFLYVNRHFVVHRTLARHVEAMYERVARYIPAVAAAMGSKGDEEEGEETGEERRRKTRGTGGGASALQRGSIKQKGGSAPNPAKQGRRRYPAFLLHIELPGDQYDLLFDPDKSSIQFANSWAATDGITQALRRWLFALYPALTALDQSIFPPTYMPAWLTKKTDEDEVADAAVAAAAAQEEAAMSPSPAPSPLTSSPDRRDTEEEDEQTTRAGQLLQSPLIAAGRLTLTRAAGDFARAPASSSATHKGDVSISVPSPMRPTKLSFERNSMRSSATPVAPSFRASFAHSHHAASSRASRAPSHFLTRPSSVSRTTSSTTNARSSGSSARTAVAPPVDTVLEIARSSMRQAADEQGERQRWSMRPEEKEEETVDGAADWTGGVDAHGQAAAAGDVMPVSTSIAETRRIRDSVPSKQRAPSESVDSGAPVTFADASLFQDLVSEQPTSLHSPVKRHTHGQPSPHKPSAAASPQYRRSISSFTAPATARASAAMPYEGVEPTEHPLTFVVDPPDPSQREHSRDVKASGVTCCSCQHFHVSTCEADMSGVVDTPSAHASASPEPESPTSSHPSHSPIATAWLPHATADGVSSSSSAPSHPIQLDRTVLRRTELIGQLDNKFLVCRVDGLLLAVDQHAADERRRLEFLQQRITHYVQHVPLLQALPLPISTGEETVLRTHEAEISAWGFRYRLADGGGTDASRPSRLSVLSAGRLLLTSVPLVCGVELDIDDLREYLQQLRDTKPLQRSSVTLAAPAPASHPSTPPSALTPFLSRTPLPVQRILNYKACRSAVMFGDALPVRTMRAVLRGLLQCDFPFNCAHGRPTMTPIVHVQPLQHTGHDDAHFWQQDTEAELLSLLTQARARS